MVVSDFTLIRKKYDSEAHFVDEEQLDLREYVSVIFPTIVNEE